MALYVDFTYLLVKAGHQTSRHSSHRIAEGRVAQGTEISRGSTEHDGLFQVRHCSLLALSVPKAKCEGMERVRLF